MVIGIFLSVMFLIFYNIGKNDTQKQFKEDCRDALILQQQMEIERLKNDIYGRRH